MIQRDTIAAISSTSGEGAIGIVRITGAESRSILSELFVSKKRKIESRYMSYGHIVDPSNGVLVDEVMAVYFAAPSTYTKEDMVEIYCHGGKISVHRILRLILERGARLAEPGEFTLRAFLNGRIDLAQAESVVDLVKAKTSRSFDSALSQLRGGVSQPIREIRALLLEVVAKIIVSVDYPEEDVEEVTWDEIRAKTSEAIRGIDNLLRGEKSGRILREGAKVAILGRPNVGKSSLMNLLLQEDRAIVTDIAGTTRDTIEEQFSVAGVPAILVDTAGIRSTSDEVEAIGVERAKMAASTADVILLVIDSSQGLEEIDIELMQYVDDRDCVLVLNKSDKPAHLWSQEEQRCLDLFENQAHVSILSNSSEARAAVIRLLETSFEKLEVGDSASIGTRHFELLTHAKKLLEDSLSSDSYDLAEIDLREAILELGKITGEDVSSELLHTIFSKFCLGK